MPVFPDLPNSSTNEELNKFVTVASLALPQNANIIIAGLYGLGQIFLGLVVTPLDCFLHVSFGFRELSLMRLINSLIALQMFGLLLAIPGVVIDVMLRANGLSGFFDSTSSVVHGVHPAFQAAFMALGLFHIYYADLQRRRGEFWHTKSWGISIFEYQVLPWLNDRLARIQLLRRWGITLSVGRWQVYRFWEPLIVILAGYLITPRDNATGLYLIIAGLALWARNGLVYMQQLHRQWDVMDSALESQYMQDAIQQKRPQDTAGIMVIPGFENVLKSVEDLDIKGRVERTFSSE